MHSHVKNDPPPIVALPTPGDHDFNKFESTLPGNASKLVSAFLSKWFLRRRFLKNKFSKISNYLPLKEDVNLLSKKNQKLEPLSPMMLCTKSG